MIDLKNKVALVTGAASGVGKSTAYAFVKAGAKVVLADISTEGKKVSEAINQEGGKTLFVQADVTQYKDHVHIVEQALTHFGRLDFAHNNAGIEQSPQNMDEIDEATWDKVMDVNLKGVWFAMKVQVPHLKNNKGGAIVNTASVAALRGVDGISAYCAAKAGVVMLGRAAALEYAKEHIRINTVCPGLVMTDMALRMKTEHPEFFKKLAEMVPMGRGCSPEEIADKVVWLCSDAASFITGQTLVADGGWLA